MPRSLRVLFVEDSPDDADLVMLELRRSGYEVVYERVETGPAMRAALAREPWDLILSDYAMPTFTGMAALAVLVDTGLDIPFIIVSGTIGEETAVAALKAGAHDFLVKGRLARLAPAIERELRDAEGRQSRRVAETALRTSDERFRAIMNAATDAVISIDSTGTVVYVNATAERMFGYPAVSLIGGPLARLVPDRSADASLSSVWGFSAEVDVPELRRTIELVGRRRDGSEFPIDVSLGSWISSGTRHVAGIIRDITDRKKTETQLLIADRLVAVGTLAAGVAHEINNPLAAIVANLDLALRDLSAMEGEIGVALTGTLVEGLRDARDASDRVRDIVRDLKVFSRGEDETYGPVDVHHVLESTLRMASNEIRHRARLVKAYGSVPLVDASEARLGQVFLNLIVNAAQAIPEGHAQANEIRISTRFDGTRVLVEIGDTGPGIAPEVMSRLFTPFLSTKPVGQGTGLGLSICRRIVTGLGGDITVANTPGAGAVFTISLVPATTTLPVAPPAVPEHVEAASRRGTILVVEDERIISRVIERALSAEHDVHVVDRARDALSLLSRGERFDLILCDLMMPEMTGMELFEAMRQVAPEQCAAVVFLTGGAFTQRAREFLDGVSNQWLEKPFRATQLRAVVNARVLPLSVPR